MLDELLGRAGLKERVDELETENERLRERLEAESERRADAVTARQEADERINRLEDRIAQLEGELERRGTGDGDNLAVRHRVRLRGRRLAEVLDRLESIRTGPEGALTATIPAAGDVPGPVEDVLEERAALAAEAAPSLVLADDEALVTVALDAPLSPSVDPTWRDRFALEREWFRPSGKYALALVRADLFALGVYDGDDRVDYRGFESDVMGSHSKGGFSQARFERLRDEQVDAHLERCREALAGVDDPLYLVGQRGAIDALVDEGVEPAATATVDATGDPEEALEDAVRSFWTTELRVL